MASTTISFSGSGRKRIVTSRTTSWGSCDRAPNESDTPLFGEAGRVQRENIAAIWAQSDAAETTIAGKRVALYLRLDERAPEAWVTDDLGWQEGYLRGWAA
jgi:hypothetical protein